MTITRERLDALDALADKAGKANIAIPLELQDINGRWVQSDDEAIENYIAALDPTTVKQLVALARATLAHYQVADAGTPIEEHIPDAGEMVGMHVVHPGDDDGE